MGVYFGADGVQKIIDSLKKNRFTSNLIVLANFGLKKNRQD